MVRDVTPQSTSESEPRTTPSAGPPERAHLGWRITLRSLSLLPKAALSRALGRLADLRLPRPLRGMILGSLARLTGMDLAEAEHPLDRYTSVNSLFVRRLREGVRRWPSDPAVISSPVDALVGEVGRIREGRLIQAKGKDYTTSELLADASAASRLEGGLFLTLYLSPRHYHRIHAPAAGLITAARHVPGRLFPVHRPAVLHIDRLFARNERVVCNMRGPFGEMAIVAVGAYQVGAISAAFDPDWVGEGRSVSNRPEPATPERVYDPPLPVGRGAEIMAFHLGSTVVLLLGGESVTLVPEIRRGSEVRVGEPLAEPLVPPHPPSSNLTRASP